MPYPQLGYAHPRAPQILTASSSLPACCEPSRRSVSEPGTGTASPRTPLYCPVYDRGLLATARHEFGSVYRSPYTSGQAYGHYTSYGADTSAFCSLGALETKEEPAGMSQTPPYCPCDSTLGQCQYDRYGVMDSGARRRNATRETTTTLKAWLQEHKKNPYPTKGEKIMLAIITKMTLTQVSTWFANARRRLKKENKVTWSPRTKGSEEKGYDEEDEDIQRKNEDHDHHIQKNKDGEQSNVEGFRCLQTEGHGCMLKQHFVCSPHMSTVAYTHNPLQKAAISPCVDRISDACECASDNGKIMHREDDQVLESKPKIWSLARTATSLNPTQYPACMHKRPPTFSCSAEFCTDRQHSSPVATLRNWVDGVFHEPLFQQRSSDQFFTNTGVCWSTTSHAAVELESVEQGNFNLLKSVKIK